MPDSGGGGSTTTIQKSDPWIGAQPYLTELLKEAQGLYNTQGAIAPYGGPSVATLPSWLSDSITSGIQSAGAQAPDIQTAMFGSLANALNPSATSYLSANAQQISGAPQVSPWLVGDTQNVSAQQVTPGMTVGSWQIGSTPNVNAMMVNPLNFNIKAPGMTAAQQGFASIAPSGVNANKAINAALYGQGMSPYLDQMAQDLVNRTQQSFGDISRGVWENLQEEQLPGIENMFNQAGSLGASRQALLEGQAIGQTNEALAREAGELSTNLSGELSNLYGGIYEGALDRSASLASQLAGLGSGERTAQANLIQQALAANAGFGQQAGLANQSTALQALLANQGIGMQGALANQGAALQAALANQGVDVQALLANQQAGLQSQGMNLDAMMQAALANQGSSLQAALANQGVDLQALLANQAAGMQSQNTNLDAWLQSALANQGTDLQAQLANQSSGLEAAGLDYKNLLAQMQAGQMLPGISQYPMSLSSAMLQSYNPLLQQQQSLYDLARSNYYETAAGPYEALLRYAGIASPSAGFGSVGSTSTNLDPYSNPLSGALGGAMSGFGLWNSIPSTMALGGFPALLPFTLGGALLGGLFS
jgi:hypothetical protein